MSGRHPYESKYDDLPDVEDKPRHRIGIEWLDVPALERRRYDARLDFTKVAEVFPLPGAVTLDGRRRYG